MLRNSRSKYFDSIYSSRGLNPKRFWSLFKLNNKTRNIPQKLSVKVTETKRTFAGNPADIAALLNNGFTTIFTKNSALTLFQISLTILSLRTLPFWKPMFSPYYIISTLIKLKVQMGFPQDY
jgi:hypothetical protein